jgi:sucrose-6-phosphate hydrolase SacC (GH32 family)
MKLNIIKLCILLIALSSCSKDRESTDTVSQVMKAHNYRPFYHYSPAKNWMNDPNGMVYYDGQYHLFYQYYPNGTTWGPMHWAHAVSKDLFTWEDKGIKLYPDDLGYIFSGSAVVDKNNTAGFKNNENVPMVAIFTHHQNITGKQVQSLAYSTDKGQSWIKYEQNPVIKNPGINDFRDPKVIWDNKTQKWIMVLAAFDKIKIYSSPNLKEWTFESDFGQNQGDHRGVWECPDLFSMKDQNGVEKWVMIVSIGGGESSGPNGGSSTQYFIGDFNGNEFVSNQTEVLWADYGTDNYAGVTWSDIPSADGRRIFLGWMSNWAYANSTPTVGWRSEMTVPREIKLVEANGKHALYFSPVKEINNLKETQLSSSSIVAQKDFVLENNGTIASGSYIVDFEIDLSLSNQFEFTIGNSLEKLSLSYQKSTGEFILDRGKSGIVDFSNLFSKPIRCPYVSKSTTLPVKILVDKSSIEIFINNGEQTITSLFFPKFQYSNMKINSNVENKYLKNITISPLKKTVIR